MSASLNTARALLQAKNYDGARRIVRKALEENPDNRRAWHLRVEIEMESGNVKEALSLARQELVGNPDDPGLREAEFFALVRLRKKREARKVFDRFKQDFPHYTHRHKTMTLSLDAMSERTKKISATLREYGEVARDPQSTKDLGIVHHRINDLWTAQRMMLEAHPHFPNDEELNAALATNSFQLAKPTTARRYASLALAANPGNRRMALLKKASWVMYWPPFYVFTVIFLLHYFVAILVGKIPSHIAVIALILTTDEAQDIWYDAIIAMTGVDIGRFQIIIFLAWMALYLFTINPGLYDKYIRKTKPVKLKKY